MTNEEAKTLTPGDRLVWAQYTGPLHRELPNVVTVAEVLTDQPRTVCSSGALIRVAESRAPATARPGQFGGQWFDCSLLHREPERVHVMPSYTIDGQIVVGLSGTPSYPVEIRETDDTAGATMTTAQARALAELLVIVADAIDGGRPDAPRWEDDDEPESSSATIPRVCSCGGVVAQYSAPSEWPHNPTAWTVFCCDACGKAGRCRPSVLDAADAWHYQEADEARRGAE